ncbi:class II fructose-bisphosphate aldolase [Collinsella sp. zg1085]|uniref:class II fructose-bisphosphate aldolase n=1 Tax=Collinsella sp. zg1085 TaxID=2844380 RepID=UPI001C0D1627|nr:class II fructose-bisphosphate aldolase [Collinsella sp. zg1085]QWT17645.1 class II fructose-bisphosphate aldolase [Collinsella sp. zg1085]
MILNLGDICHIAEQHEMALAAFNVPSLEALRAVLDAAEETGYPVIIQHAECHEEMVPLRVMGPAMVALAECSSAQVCVHLDHCEHLSYMREALELGFSGAMFDGSMLPYEKNVELSAYAAEMCAPYNCGLECELGSMGAREGGDDAQNPAAQAMYTNPELVSDFVAATGLDILACSFGTVHGLYRGEPKLSIEILNQIRERVHIPLVMHGGSGVSDDDYRRAIEAGIRKINYYTYGVKYAAEAVLSLVDSARTAGTTLYWHDMTGAAYERMRQDAVRVMTVFANGAAPVC